MSINVAIVENDETILRDLARLVDSTLGLQCSGRYLTVQRALSEHPFSRADVVLMDINLRSSNGIESIRRLKQANPSRLILVRTSVDCPRLVLDALSAGATGYLLKSGAPEQIVAAIHEVYQGGAPMTGSIARKLVNLFQQFAVPERDYRSLSVRQRQVLDLLAKGYRYKEIADQLKLSYATVHTHIRHIYKKLRINCRTEAVSVHLRQRVWPVQAWTGPAKIVKPETRNGNGRPAAISWA